MTIIDDKRGNLKVKFDDIHAGDLFDFEGAIWLKIEDVKNLDETVMMGNAVELDNGLLDTFLPCQYVTPIKKVAIIE